MTKKKSTKRALISSLLILAMCFTMLAGTTFAWFTDSVASTGNKIVSGKLDIALYMADATNAYNEITANSDPIFGKTDSLVAQNNPQDTLWEPGKTQFAFLQVKNLGNLWAKYRIIVDVTDGGLIGSLQYAVLDRVKAGDYDLSTLDWATVSNMAQVGDLAAGRTVAANQGSLAPAPADGDYFALAIHMKEEAGNEYQEKDVTINITVIATQDDVEEDAFDTTYDSDAEFPVAEVATFAELKAAIEDPDIVSVTLTDNIDVTQSLNVSGKTMTLDMNGKTLSNTNDIWGVANQGDWSLLSVGNGANVTITGNGQFIAKENDCYAVDVWGGSNLTIENGTFVGNMHAVYIYEGNLVVNGGDYSIKQLSNANPAYPYGFILNCYDANYNAGKANYVVNGGTFHGFNPAESYSEPTQPKSFVGAGKTVTEDTTTNPATYTVA